MVRTSARARKVVSYAIPTVDGVSNEDIHAGEASSDDNFNAGESSEDAESEGEPTDEEDEDEDSDEDFSGADTRPTKKKVGFVKKKQPLQTQRSTAYNKEDDDEGTATKVHKTHVRAVESGKEGKRRKARLMAEGVSMKDIRAPDPTVRITYRPGFAKATGKRDRVVQVYGDTEDILEAAVKIRNTYMPLPALPERSTLMPTPFMKNEAYEVMDCSKQVTRAMELHETAEYIGNGAELKLVVGRHGAWEMIKFKQFATYDLKKVSEEKRGFYLNAGAQVLSVDYATNRPEGTQYLAVSTQTDTSEHYETPPAFSRLPSKSTIQIWRIRTSDTYAPTGEPSIALMLCHDWGPARNLKWCPMPLNLPPGVLGYLSAVLADGNVRILKIPLPEDDDDNTCSFIHYTSPAYEATLADEILTQSSWISPTAIAVGCASGYIAAFDFEAGPVPYMYMPIHHTYITGLSTCWPSFPHHIVSCSMDGYSRVTALCDAEAETVPNNRSRIAPGSVAYLDSIQSGISIEEGTWVKFFPLRRYFSATTTSKHTGIVRHIASSFMHTLVVTGGTEGEAIFSNPSRRLFHGKIKNYQQTWFQVEYTAVNGGAIRITEGFKLEECEGKSKIPGGQQFLTTVFPKQVAVGATGWNNNKNFGGWAVAGVSCGLIRVEDVTVEK
ncbi:hypothetical protein BZA77DRAFT_1169 [Pyronema omphalodes]|nr:hypothetical protein BZA77DRAFT_1169 [Pyronema omphalodes]